MPKIAAGVVRFQKEVYPEKRELFARLAEGQRPDALFITCSDSRIDPNLVTQTEPGELFICRNAGNIVPPHANRTGGMTASIEYAVAVLGVKDIVVCGHIGCGAIEGAMHPERIADLPHVSEWLGYSRAAVQIVAENGKHLDPEARLQMLLEQNVLLQLQHLRTHPHVAAGLAGGRLELHGWVYDILHGGMTAYANEADGFVDVETRYAEDIARYADSIGGGRS
jgi:carbonic anhydrase